MKETQMAEPCPKDGISTCGPASDCPHLEFGPDQVEDDSDGTFAFVVNAVVPNQSGVALSIGETYYLDQASGVVSNEHGSEVFRLADPREKAT